MDLCVCVFGSPQELLREKHAYGQSVPVQTRTISNNFWRLIFLHAPAQL